MSDTDVILKVENLSKTYFSKHRSQRSVKDMFSYPFQEVDEDADRVDALKDVSFELKRGESLGIIGPNGAGKSTLLKILSGVTAPSSGKVTINGRVLSVLDIGTGFHPDLTGRENVYLNGEILGMSRKEIDGNYKKIVEFSGIGEFIDRPVKQYSSGMYLRLAFSIVVTLDADILLFDEVLSVGDANFRLRTSSRIRELARSGRSIILVTHNMGEILESCNDCILLENGVVSDSGQAFQLVSRYSENAVMEQRVGHSEKEEDASAEEYEESELNRVATFVKHPERKWTLSFPGNENFQLVRMAVHANDKCISERIYMKDAVEIELDIKKEDESKLDLGILLTDIHGNMVLGGTTMMNPTPIDNSWAGQQHYSVVIPGNLLNYGVFGVSVAYIDDAHRLNSLGDVLLYFKVFFNEEERGKPWFEQFPGVIRPRLKWSIQSGF